MSDGIEFVTKKHNNKLLFVSNLYFSVFVFFC